MTRSTPTRKQTVSLAEPAARVSRIRRDPPPETKVITAAEIKERDAQDVAVGIIVVALALFVIMVGFGKATGWSPEQHAIHVNLS
jgi:hypothetical protein